MTKDEINVFTEDVEKMSEQMSSTNDVEDSSIPTGRKVIDETTIDTSKWINLPKGEELGESTPEIKISVYYNQDGKDMVNKTTGKPFYTGLEKSDGTRAGEFIVEGISGGDKAKMRLSSWELVFKMNKLVSHCASNNLTLANQVISIKRLKSGPKTAGENWELLVPSLKVKISGKDNEVVKL